MKWFFERVWLYFCVTAAISVTSVSAVEPLDPADKYTLPNVPTDLQIPPNVTLISGGLPTSHSGSGTMLDGQWFLSHGHYPGPNDANTPPFPGKEIVVNGVTYYSSPFTDENDPRAPKIYENQAILVKLADINGDPVTIPGVQTPLPMPYPLRGMIATVGGFGDVNDGERGQLRWGKRTVDYNSGRLAATGLTSVTSDTSFYPKYAANLESGDSGSGHFARDGWDWRYLGPFEGQDIALRYQAQVAQDIPGFVISGNSATPTATATWTATTTGDWATGTNWQAGSTPTASDTVWIDQASISQVNSGVAHAGDLFIGSAFPSSSYAQVTVQGGDLEVADTIYLAADAQTRGDAVLSSGSVTAQRTYVGYRGEAVYFQSGGSHTVEGLFVVGKAPGSSGAYAISGAQAQLKALGIVVGAEPGSTGTFTVINAESVHTPLLTVGHSGDGTFIQAGGQVTTDDLWVGLDPSSDGSYTLTGGSLDVGYLHVGGDRADSLGTRGQGLFTYSGGELSITKDLKVSPDGTFIVDGRTLTMHSEARILQEVDGHNSVIDFNNTAGKLSFLDSSTVDLAGAKFIGAGNATLELRADALVYTNGADSDTALFGQATPHFAHVKGTTMTVGNSEGFITKGIIEDQVVVQGGGAIDTLPGEALELKSGLTMLPLASVDLGDGWLLVLPVHGPSTIYGDGFSSAGVSVIGGTLYASGTLSTGVILLDSDSTLGITSGSSSLTVNAPVIITQDATIDILTGDSITLLKGVDASQATSGSIIDLGSGALSVPNGTTSKIGANTLFYAGLVAIQAGGKLEAAGTLDTGYLSNGGELSVGIGTVESLMIDGDLASLSTASINIDLAGTSTGSYDTLQFNGNAVLDGNLVIESLFTPSMGDAFLVISAGGELSGEFDIVFGVNDVDGITMGLVYDYGLETVTIKANLEGDLNGDGFVGILDLGIVQDTNHWNMEVTAADLLSGDADGDGFVGINDLNIVLGNWNAGTPPISLPNVPEPASLALLGLGGLAAIRRR
jgi:T5SS/PEP-CTERM-associated repeat protein